MFNNPDRGNPNTAARRKTMTALNIPRVLPIAALALTCAATVAPTAQAATTTVTPTPTPTTTNPTPPPVPKVTGISYTYAPTNVIFYQPTWNVTGRITGTTGAPLGGQTVVLQRMVGTSPYSTLATGKTTSTGTFSLNSNLGVNGVRSGYAYRVIVTPTTGGMYATTQHAMHRVLPADSVRLTDTQARNALRSKSIGWYSSGNCTNRYNSSCTSFDTIRTQTIREIIRTDYESKCNILVTGGTETGHATGTYSHWNGYKFDLNMSSCLTNFIHARAKYTSYAHYYRPSVLYYNERNHWDHVVGGPVPSTYRP